ncbi:hypothetical protein GCM10027259_23350 [Micromonospora palomenae]
MEGAPAVLCAECGNDGDLVDKALTVARRAWINPAEDSDVDDELVDQLRGNPEGVSCATGRPRRSNSTCSTSSPPDGSPPTVKRARIVGGRS